MPAHTASMAVTPATGTMRLVQAPPNPQSSIDALFLLKGDGTGAPVGKIENTAALPDVPGRGRLQVFHFNDLHNHLTELSGNQNGTHRFSQMVRRVRDARRKKTSDDALLFLSVGDDHTGSVLDELLGWRPDQFVLDASYRAYSAAGIDATVLGNHEFDRGAELLASGIRQDANFPVLSANVHSSAHLVPGQDYHPAAIIISGGLRIGLIGLTTHVETRTGQSSDPDFAVAGPVSVVQNILPALAPLVDVVLILSHCGFGDGAHKSGKAAAARDIGEADFSIAGAATAITDKPLLVLGAHTHTKLNPGGLESCNIFGRVPVFQCECNGRFLGEIDLRIEPGLPGGFSVTKTCLHPIKPRDDTVGRDHPDFGSHEQPGDFDQQFEAETIAPLIDKVQGILSNEIAKVDTRQLSFKLAATERYSGECSLLNFMSDAICLRLKSAGINVDFSLVNAATVLAGIEPGVLSMGAWFDVMPYADEIYLMQMTGVQFQQILHNNAKRFLRPEEVLQTDCTGFVGRGFAHTSHQIRYRIALNETARDARAVSVEINGQALLSLQDQVFSVAMPTYLALGAFGERWNGRSICGGVPGDLAGYDLRRLPSENTHLIYRNEIAAYICETGRIDDNSGPFRDGRLQIVTPEPGEG